MQYFRRNAALIFLSILALTSVYLLYVVFAEEHSGKLTVAFLDVGQGDAIFIESPTGTQVIVDGGPDASVLRGVAKLVPFYDRSIDALIITNPDKDHIAGFLDVLRRYKVGQLIEPGVEKETVVYKAIKNEVTRQNIPILLARRGQIIDLGGGAALRILFPDRDVAELEPNTGSLVAQLIYKDTALLLMGDSVTSVEKYLVALDGERLRSDIVKTGHHGSRTSTSDELLSAARPTFAVISSGKDNTYGHPHKEVLDILAGFGAEVLRTDQSGTIVFKSDGRTLTRK